MRRLTVERAMKRTMLSASASHLWSGVGSSGAVGGDGENVRDRGRVAGGGGVRDEAKRIAVKLLRVRMRPSGLDCGGVGEWRCAGGAATRMDAIDDAVGEVTRAEEAK